MADGPRKSPSNTSISRAKGVLSGLENLSERQVSRNRISATRQHDRHCLHQQQRGYTFPQLMTLALEMWDWCQERDILVIASHIPGGDNVSADRGSREFTDMSERKLDPIIIQPFRLNFQTDLSASRLASQHADYISWRPDPRGIHTYAFTINWATLRGYAFPPFNLISKTLTKLTIDQTELILVAPVWQAQPWWPVLLRLLISQPVLLPNSPTLLTDPTDLNRVHPMYPRLHLAEFHISTNVSKLRAFRQTLPIYSSQQLAPPHTKPTSLVGPLVPLVFWTAN